MCPLSSSPSVNSWAIAACVAAILSPNHILPVQIASIPPNCFGGDFETQGKANEGNCAPLGYGRQVFRNDHPLVCNSHHVAGRSTATVSKSAEQDTGCLTWDGQSLSRSGQVRSRHSDCC